MKYFENIETADEARVKYIELMKKFHPDKNPEMSQSECNFVSQEIQGEYQNVLSRLREKEIFGGKNEKSEAHKSTQTDFSDNKHTKPLPKSKLRVPISKNQAKKGIDLLYEALNLVNDIRSGRK